MNHHYYQENYFTITTLYYTTVLTLNGDQCNEMFVYRFIAVLKNNYHEVTVCDTLHKCAFRLIVLPLITYVYVIFRRQVPTNKFANGHHYNPKNLFNFLDPTQQRTFRNMLPEKCTLVPFVNNKYLCVLVGTYVTISKLEMSRYFFQTQVSDKVPTYE